MEGGTGGTRLPSHCRHRTRTAVLPVVTSSHRYILSVPLYATKAKRNGSTVACGRRNTASNNACMYIITIVSYSRLVLHNVFHNTQNTGVEGGETAIKLARRWGYDVKGVQEVNH